MQNSISKSLVVVNNTPEAEGFALAKEYKSITRGDKARFTKATKADGFDTRLGKLMQKLKAEGGERISTQRLKDCGIDGIDKRRRAEALWFVENETEVRAFIETSGFKGSSLTALQAAMRKASKEAEAEPTEVEAEEAEPSKEEVSNVGRSSKPSKDDIVKSIVKACQYSGIDLLDIAEALMEIDTVSEAEETETNSCLS